jgi:transcription elongation factor GreA
LIAASLLNLIKTRNEQITLPKLPDFENILSGQTDLSMLLNDGYDDEVVRFALRYLHQKLPQTWYETLSCILPGGSVAVCDWISSELLKEGAKEPFFKAIEMITHWPERYVRATVWLWKSIFSGKNPQVFDSADKTAVMTGLFTAAQAIKRKPPFEDADEQKRTLTQIKNVVSDNNYAQVRKVLTQAGDDYVHYFKETVGRNTGLGEAVATDIMKIMRETHPRLFTKYLPPWEEDAIYTTEGALAKKNEEFARLVNVEIAHNAKTIGEAADRGDLRENAEFTAALEERDRLTERAGKMRADIKKAKVIYPGMVSSDSVSIGARITAENLQTSETEYFVFLGPWDADPQRRTYSYLSPLAQSFMGKKIGETVIHTTETEETKWKIKEISSGL